MIMSDSSNPASINLLYNCVFDILVTPSPGARNYSLPLQLKKNSSHRLNISAMKLLAFTPFFAAVALSIPLEAHLLR